MCKQDGGLATSALSLRVLALENNVRLDPHFKWDMLLVGVQHLLTCLATLQAGAQVDSGNYHDVTCN